MMDISLNQYLKLFSSAIFLLLLISYQHLVVGQEVQFTLSGYVKDSTNGEMLQGATISFENINVGTICDSNGYYSFTLPEGRYPLKIEYAGYQTQQVTIDLTRNFRYDIDLLPFLFQQDEIVVTAPASRNQLKAIEMGKIDIDINQIKKLPVLFGEVDLLKSLQLLPGIQGAGEGSTGIYVRGGGADQNLVLLDDATIYNPGHLFGFFSVFNSDAIKNLNMYKGNMPAKYVGRISSVLDFSMKEGINKKYQVLGGIGLIASRLTIEGPIKKEKGSFIISARRTYIDQITKPLVTRDGVKGLPYYFYDINVKANYAFSEKNKLFVSTYVGRDDVRLTLLDGRVDSKTSWGNNTMSLRWNHVANDKTFLNCSVIYNRYQFSSSARFDDFQTNVYSGIEDVTGKIDLDFYPSIRHHIQAGSAYTFHTYVPRRTDASTGGMEISAIPDARKYAHEGSLYISDDISLSDTWLASIGLRLNLFQPLGPYQFVNDELGNKDTIRYERFEILKTYLNPEPRIGLRYSINSKSSIKTAFNLNNQYVHLVSVSGNALPFDIWVPSSIKIKPQRGWQYSIGYFRNVHHNQFELSLETYYKRLYNLPDYREDYVPQVAAEPESEYVYGNGKAYGAEFLIRKNKGKLKGWIGYTLSKATRQFEEINNGNIFPAKYDRRHDLSLVASYDLNARWVLSATFAYASGQLITLPQRRYFIGGVVYNEYGTRNGFKMQPYNRLDLSATYENKKTTHRFHSSWTFAIYNVYNRKNPYIYFIDAQGDVTQSKLNINAKKLYLFPIMPSVTWNFKF